MLLITGSSGFIGSHLLHSLDHKARLVSRSTCYVSKKHQVFFIDEFSIYTDWNGAFSDIDCVVHLAAIAHQNLNNYRDNVDLLFDVNYKATVEFAKKAAQSGVKRFIYISSVGVNGNVSDLPFTETDPVHPVESYALSKKYAEDGLIKISKKFDMEVVIIRPPMVYGPNAPGNFRRLLRIVCCRFPLPLRSIQNKRSFIGIENLVDFILLCTVHERAANEIFLISDSQDVSLIEFIRLIARALGKKVLIFSFPVQILKLLSKILGKSDEFKKISVNLQVNSDKAKLYLSWRPKLSVESQLSKISSEHF